MTGRHRFCAVVLSLQVLLASANATAAAPLVFHTPDFESPVRGGPDDLVFLGGSGFSPADRVVYEALREGEKPSTHPQVIPAKSTPQSGTASVVKIGDPPLSLTIRLPPVISPSTAYRFWIVNAASEWSEPFTLNDPRPLWVSPAYVYATADLADLGRRLRIVGRNLAPPAPTQTLQVRLRGPKTYLLNTVQSADPPAASAAFVAEAALPERLVPGDYAVSVSRAGLSWTEVPEQRLQVLADPPAASRFKVSDPRFGSCVADDDSDDSECVRKAIAAAQQAGGGIVEFPRGTWDLYPSNTRDEADFTLTANVSFEGAGADATTLLRRDSPPDRSPSALLLLEGNNSITRLKFADQRRFSSFENSRPVIELGHRWDEPRIRAGELPAVVRNIVISHNLFRRVGMAVIDGGLPIEQLFVTGNDFGGYARGLELPGASHSLNRLFRIEDTVIRRNRFVPGSYLDLPAGQGVIATGMGASRRVDFSSNDVDGASAEGLQEPTDPPGWRAGFFWNMNDSAQMLLLADNKISCSGDKAGDGEAVAFDGNGDTFGYQQAAQVSASTRRSVTVAGAIQAPPTRWEGGTDSYYVGHWIQVVAGPGLGQTRRIQSYKADPSGNSVVFEVSPAWDVPPVGTRTRVIVGRQFWQTFVVGNEITQATPPCRKSNLSGPKGGEITMWAPSADSVIEGNRQFDTSGIGFTQGYTARTPSCTTCANYAAVEMALEIRGNLVQGEYDWTSACSVSGIHGTFGASPTPEAPPPIVSFGVQVTHNVIEHSDGLRGGAIDILPTWHLGPEPLKWPLIDNLILAHNVIRDVEGPPPRDACHYTQRERTGIRIEGGADVLGTVLYNNSCEKVGTRLTDGGVSTKRLCEAHADSSCECH